MKKSLIIVVSAMALVLVFSGVAAAHVSVFPKETTQGSYEKFTVRVPTERDVPTVKVEVKISEDVEISRFEPKAGWSYDIERNAEDKITSVTWTATGDGLGSTEFGEFNMQGKVGDMANSIIWKAYQTYEDGEVVEWTGGEDADKPASVTRVKAKPAGAPADGHGHTEQVTGPGEGSVSEMPLYLSIVALALSLVALLVSFTRRRT